MSRLTAISSLRVAPILLLCTATACSNNGGGAIDAGPGWMSVPDAGDSGPAAMPDAGPAVDAGPGADAGPPSGDGGTVSEDGGPPPMIRSITPPLGSVLGGTNIIIYGSGFANGFAPNGGLQADQSTYVTIGQMVLQSNINVIDDTTLEVVTPPWNAGTVDVIVRNPNGSVTSPGAFTFIPQIAVTQISPASGPTSGGTTLTITGEGFASGMLVTIGGSEATDIQVTGGTTITCVTPPGVAGSADVGVIAANAEGWLRRGYVYFAPVVVTSVTPPTSPLAGGGTVTVVGSGFTPDATVTFGTAAPATPASVASDGTSLTVVVPAATAAGAVPVTVTTDFTSGLLPAGFAYYDDSTSLQIFAVVPSQSPAAGGINVQLLGTGLAGNGLQVAFGDNMATLVAGGTANDLTVTVPAATAPGVVDVQARSTTGGGFDLPMSFAYVSPLTLTSITPDSGPEAGGTAVTIAGTGLSGACQIFIGPAQATFVSAAASGTSISVTTPAGPAGTWDVRAACGTAGSPQFQTTTLPAAFTYAAPMQLLSVDPGTGAIAGNTAVTLYGDGFVDGMKVFFGTGEATMVQVLSSNIATLLTPPGQVGYVDVTIQAASQAGSCTPSLTTCSVLPAGFGYYDPTNANGGGSDGPMLGILNVTVLQVQPNGSETPLPGATVSVNQDEFTGITDQDGQITFSSPLLLKPVSITASMSGFAASTIALINARDVTLLMSPNGPSSPPSSGPGPMPATFNGEVCGFKLPVEMTLQPGQEVQAQVFQTYEYVYAAPPFADANAPVVVSTDCGSFSLQTTQFGPTALYAFFGVADNSTSPPTFTPLLLGFIRGLEADPGGTTNGLDIILSVHLDQNIPVTIDESELGSNGTEIINDVFSFLNLGGEGVIPLANTESTDATFAFTNHPDVEGQSLVFLNLAATLDPTSGSADPPYSLCFQQQYGDLSAGVTIGPMMAFTEWISPATSEIFSGTLTWGFQGSDPANIQQVTISEPMGFSSVPIWNVILPGTDESVSIPPSASSTFPPGTELEWSLITAQSPNLVYNAFGFEQLGVNDWTSFTENFGSFSTAQ